MTPINIDQIVKYIPIEWLADMFIDAARKVLDDLIPGDKLSPTAQKIVISGYCEAKIWLEDIVKQTATVYDDKVLNLFIEQCEDLANEGAFTLPSFPD